MSKQFLPPIPVNSTIPAVEFPPHPEPFQYSKSNGEVSKSDPTNNNFPKLGILQSNSKDLFRILSSDHQSLVNQALICAEQGDLLGITRCITQAGAMNIIHCRGLHGYTLLHHACNRGHVSIVAELIKWQAIIDVRNDLGETPLHLAVYAGNILIVDQLIDNGARVNCSNNDDETPLFYAARRSMPAIIRLLLQRGADVNIKDKFGDYAIDHAVNTSTIKAFDTKTNDLISSDSYKLIVSYSDLLKIFSYLTLPDVLRCACVCTKWHRVTENEIIWKQLGVRRWEIALQSSLGFAPTASSSFYRPKNLKKVNSSHSKS